MINLVFQVRLRLADRFSTPGCEVPIPAIHIIGHQGQDHPPAGLDWFNVFAKPQECVGSCSQDQTGSLVAHHRKAEDMGVKIPGGLQVPGVEECDLLFEGQGFHAVSTFGIGEIRISVDNLSDLIVKGFQPAVHAAVNPFIQIPVNLMARRIGFKGIA